MCAAGALVNIEGPALDEMEDGLTIKKDFLKGIVNLMSLSIVHNELHKGLNGKAQISNKIIVWGLV